MRSSLRPSPTTDLTDILTELSILRANIDVILEMRETEPETTPPEFVEDSVLDALFNVHVESWTEHLVCTKRHRSSHTNEDGDEECAKKREERAGAC